MPKNSISSQENSAAFEFKSSIVTVPVIHLFNGDSIRFSEQLQEKVNLAPGFFKHSSVLIDLQDVEEQSIDLDAIVKIIQQASMLVIGIRSGSKEQQQAAKDLSLPLFDKHTETPVTNTTIPEAATLPTPAVCENLLITQPVRSGQRIYAKGDIIITAPVSPGAELLAEGNIHIYNVLRGRALAGVLGDESALIFCSNLQAELISIAGNYRISEDIDDTLRKSPVQIHLDQNALIIENI
mgnify:CR=1 FL=1